MNSKAQLQPVKHDKGAVGAAFSRAAQGYDSHAAFQRQVGERLLTLAGPQAIGRCLDLGCGSGYFSEQLHAQGHQIVALDLAMAMATATQQRCDAAKVVVADADALPMQDNTVDLAFSNLALQWSDNLQLALSQLKRVVKPGGRLLFSTLATGSLTELDQAWQQAHGRHHINRFLSPDAIRMQVAQAGFSPSQLMFETITLHYPSALAVMKALKGVGANHLNHGRAPGLTGKGTLQRLQRAYATQANSHGLLPLTYQVCFGTLTNDA
ncbi:pimeloyl-CoA biosynthesis protein BioC [Ferrimonas sediminum]|uniref:Malonyl-[acyl-carrier protein] O-methyltransferase n=1 Tax=Ferrimonas sediminum TaxID=718193 RepID=A0A1G9AQI8_9GAMM|nr:malonyl-ACP O-methyltransferase BioC [Ferrimonas sediminum]SDK28815.1 pimeloyl-CoA biosynthesis protein BioC [Ferrimonas sediminum]